MWRGGEGTHVGGERAAVAEFHDEEAALRGLEDFLQGDDVRMINPLQNANFQLQHSHSGATRLYEVVRRDHASVLAGANMGCVCSVIIPSSCR